MLVEFRLVWECLGEIFSAIPSDIVTVASFIFCGVGVVGIFRSF